MMIFDGRMALAAALAIAVPMTACRDRIPGLDPVRHQHAGACTSPRPRAARPAAPADGTARRAARAAPRAAPPQVARPQRAARPQMSAPHVARPSAPQRAAGQILLPRSAIRRLRWSIATFSNSSGTFSKSGTFSDSSCVQNASVNSRRQQASKRPNAQAKTRAERTEPSQSADAAAATTQYASTVAG